MGTGSQPETGMVVMEVEMVSGWEAKFSEIESLVNDVNYEMQRVERGKEDKDNVVLYFDSWPRQEQCITLPLKQDTIINEPSLPLCLFTITTTPKTRRLSCTDLSEEKNIFSMLHHMISKYTEKKEQRCIVSPSYEVEIY